MGSNKKECDYEEISEHYLAERMLKRQNLDIYPQLFVKFRPNNVFLPKDYAAHYENIRNMEVRNVDIWLMSFIKSGTTWTQELTWLLGNNLDFEGAKELITIRFPYLEFDAPWKVNEASTMLKNDKNDETALQKTSMEIVSDMKSPRFIKTHLPLSLLPPQISNLEKRPKIIYVARNPKDVCVSFYHHRVLVEGYKGTIDEFVEEFTADLTLYGPYWNHIKEFWKIRHEPNVFFVSYESMKENLKEVVTNMSKFFGKKLSDEDTSKLVKHLSFENMKLNPAVNYDEVTQFLSQIHGGRKLNNFMRKGKIGSWREELSEKSIAKLDDWIKKNEIPGIFNYGS